MFLFIASEIMLFGSFFTVYFFDRVVNHGVNGHWPPEGFHRPAFVHSHCGASGEALRLEVPIEGPGSCDWLFHCAVPAAQWWDDIVFT